MDDKVTEKERYEIIHKMSRRVASVDKYCVVSVSNKAFEEYFGHIVDTLLEVVALQDKERLINFIDNMMVPLRVECLSLLMHGERKDIIIFLYMSSAVLAMNI